MSSPPAFWDGVLRRLGADTPAFSLDAWVRPLAVQEHAGGLRLVCPTAFHRERVRERFLPRIACCVEEESGQRLEIELEVGDGGAAPQDRPSAQRPNGHAAATPSRPAPRGQGRVRAVSSQQTPATPRRPPLRQQPDEGAAPALAHSFDSFVVGPCNALAREASFALAMGGQRGLDSLFLSSSSGNGKSHLARALVHEAKRRGRRALYESAEGFTNRFMSALRNRSTEDFKRRYRQGCELLVVEDVEFLDSKKSTQLELFHTLQHLVDAGARVVLTADRLPRDIGGFDERLRSQITAGLVAEIEVPDAEVRRRILRSKAAAGGVRLPDDCLDLLVACVRGSVRDLEGALIQLVATASLLKQPIDVALTRTAMHKLAPVHVVPPRLDLETVIGVVTGFFGVTRDALASRSRRRDVLLPRQLAMYLCRRYSDASLVEIAHAFAREHPSVSNAEKAVERGILERAPLRYQVEELTARLDRISDS
jgi:chromosomal replication initiator protein